MTALTFVVLALCSYRVTRLVYADHLTQPIRQWVADHLPTFLDDLVQCPWCVGVHVSAGVVYAATWFASIPLPVAVWGAVACVVGFMSQVDDG